jgi:glycosyltransferase involved in cell wall biosynthesis
MAGEIANGIAKPFRIGIFWETESDAFPQGKGKEILGDLVGGLLNLEKPVEVVLYVRPEDRDVTAELKNQSSGRLVSVLFLDRPGCPQSWNTILRKAGRRLAAVAETKEIIANLTRRGRSRISTDIRRVLRGARSKWRKSPVAGFLPMVLGGCLAFSIILAYWFIFSVMQLGTALLRSLFFPAPFFLKIDALRRSFDRLRLSLDPLILAKETYCDVWLVPSLTFPYSLKNLRAATVVMLPQTLNGPISQELAGLSVETADGIPSNRAAEASLCVRLTSNVPDGHLEPVLGIDPARFRQMPLVKAAGDLGPQGELHSRDRKEAAQKWLDVFREAVEIARWRATFDEHVISPWSSPEVFLFLQIPYEGGVWETTKDLVRALVEINRERQQLTLTVAVEEAQKDTGPLEELAPELPLERFRFGEISRAEGAWLLEKVGKSLSPNPPGVFSFMKGCESAALRADAWLALVDRFWAPLLPLRPYGVVVYDMIQRHSPQGFAPVFLQWMKEGMKPTVREAHTVLVTSTATRDDAIAEYQLDPSRIEMVPVACEPHRRFSSVAIDPVPRARAPFILSVANASGHKGAEVLLRAYARLKKQVRGHVPLLVLAGWRTDALAPSYRGGLDDKYWIRIRQLIRELGLVDNRDLACLGFVSDSQLLDLYQRCAVVVNAAKHDNGSFSLIEGAYFGRPLISSRYPAVESLCERFGISPRFFPIDDDAGLAMALEQALQEKPVQGDDLKSIRDRLRVPELSYRLYAERIYRILVELADQGRKERLSGKPPAYQPETRSTAA